jgi:protocatechuate 3,4-dioxygenase beta subunit
MRSRMMSTTSSVTTSRTESAGYVARNGFKAGTRWTAAKPAGALMRSSPTGESCRPARRSRSDVREGKAGTPLTLTVKVVNASNGCAAVANADVEIWHVDAAGSYSQYGTQAGQTYLRGIQTTNSNGEATFITIYPGWYQGRATHIHLEVTVGGRSVKVTQIALPESVNAAVHGAGVYASRGQNPIANAADNILADSLSSELVTPTGSPSSGYAVTFQVGIAI